MDTPTNNTFQSLSAASNTKPASPFTDVDASAYYAKAAQWAAEQGMASGSTFSPSAPCTRMMAVEFM
ncbi:MAG: S-layer homology domain-containing protein [Clostridiales bacterium]|nr:S-layer homology domain-containing protein [Clostridiales bacterium]